jgi:hypothetical protein
MHDPMNKKWLIGLWALFFWQSNAHAQLHQRALFLGNSYTYVNDLPGMISTFAYSAGDTSAYASNASTIERLPKGYVFTYTNFAIEMTKEEQ